MSPIHYTLHESNVMVEPGQCLAHVHPSNTFSLDQLIDRIVKKGSTVCRSDILSVLDDFQDVLADVLMEGASVTTPLANYRPSIQGIFANTTDSFDPNRHQVVVRILPGRFLRRVIRMNSLTVKEEASKYIPNPLQYIDVVSGELNGRLTPGEGARLVGHRLRFDPSNVNQGLFFEAEDGTVTRVERLIKIAPAEVILIAPALAAGLYTLQVRADLNGNGEIRTGKLEATLQVL